MEIRGDSKDHIGRVLLDYEPGLTTFPTKLRRKNDQVANRTASPGEGQCPAVYTWSLAKHDKVGRQTGTTNAETLFTEDRSPEGRYFNVGAEYREQVAVRRAILVGQLSNIGIGSQPDPSRRILQPLFELPKSKTLVRILHSINAVSPLTNATASS